MITSYDLYQQPAKVLFALLIVLSWSLIWKGLGLWYAAKEGKKGWFLAILILNTLGLLPIIYLLWFRERVEETDLEPSKTQEEEVKEKLKKKNVKKKKVKEE